MINLTLTAASIIFGLLSGFFISQLWTRYTEVRALQGDRTSATLSMISSAEYFFRDRRFKKDFLHRVELSEIVDQVINWDEGHVELPYYQDIEKSFRKINIRNDRDQEYFSSLLTNHRDLNRSMIRMNVLYKERLFASEWLILIVLSILIGLSILFLNAGDQFYKMVVIVFPPIIALSLLIIYDLDQMTWEREIVTLEPAQIVLETIGAKRFYMKRDLLFVEHLPKVYRTENTLTGEFKKTYLAITEGRK